MARRTDPGRALAVAVGAVLVLFMVAAVLRPPWRLVPREFGLLNPVSNDPPDMPVQPSGAPSGPPRSVGDPATAPDWLKWALLAVAIGVVVLILVRVLRWLLDRMPPPRDELDDAEVTVLPELPVLRRGADDAERFLLQGGDPTDAIVAAWVSLEQAAASSGVQRGEAQTPTEFTADVLRGTGADPGAVATLLRLYLHARFSAQGATVADLDEARSCVRTLAADWSARMAAQDR